MAEAQERRQKAVKDISRELIALYAKRKASKGFAFSADSYLQHELEASFRWEDTPDQQAAIAAVKKDMESDQPMDRLVCGDVGFGKTEVAIRAAFKAATDGKQVAVLVPTTILALQHFRSFSERLREFPVRIEYLNRTKSAREVAQIRDDLPPGASTSLIGTHKMLGKQIVFRDLGLLIIDEEQKFGVAAKEKLTQLSVSVDTLTRPPLYPAYASVFAHGVARPLRHLHAPAQPSAHRHRVARFLRGDCPRRCRGRAPRVAGRSISSTTASRICPPSRG